MVNRQGLEPDDHELMTPMQAILVTILAAVLLSLVVLA